MSLKIAYVPAHLPSYYAKEYQVFDLSRQGLEQLSREFNFELYSCDPIVTRAEAKQTADRLEAQQIDFVLLQNSTFVMGDVVLEFAERNFKLGLWATQEPTKSGPIMLNNFVSMNLNASILTRYLKTKTFKWFYGNPDHPWLKERLKVTLQALHVLKRLAGAKIGLIGGIAPTFYNFVFDEKRLRHLLGLEVISHELSEVFVRCQKQSDEAIQNVIRQLYKASENRVEVSERDMQTSAKVYLSLLELAKEHGYDALAISDWPAFQSELSIHPGMAFSWLDEHDHIPVASEGDVLGSITMLMMNEINQGQSMLLDMNDLDFERDAVLMWHCGGSPLGFVNDDGVIWKNHSTLGRKTLHPPMGAVADFIFKPQKATLSRLSNDGKELFVLEAHIIESLHLGYDGSRGWLSNFSLNGKPVMLADLVNTIMTKGIEHHFVLASGHYAAVVQEFATWTGINIIEPLVYAHPLQSTPNSFE
jgi:L-fucose isomerase-like protein